MSRARATRGPALGCLGLLGAAVLWEILALLVASNLFLPRFSAVVGDLWRWTSSGEIVPHLVASGIEFVVGFTIGALLGVLLGGLMGLSPVAQQIFGTLVAGLYASPRLALTPLFVLWFGFGLTSKVAIIVVTTVFPVLLNFQQGVRQAEPAHLDAVRSLGASQWQLTRLVRLPSSIPFLLVGMRIAVGRSIVAIFVAELFGARQGIGYSIIEAGQTFNTARLFSGIAVLAVFGIALTLLVEKVGELISPWLKARELAEE